MFSSEQKALLEAKLDAANIKQRSQSGRTFSYIEAWQATAECNTVFGHEGWDHEAVDVRLVMERERKLGKAPNEYDGWGVSYVCKVRVTVRAGDVVVVREGVGAGHGVDRDLGQAHESAVKEAESDALKRALKSFGWRFGLALYDKDQGHVEVAPKADVKALLAQIEGMPNEAALKAWAKEYEGEINAQADADIRAISAAYKKRLTALRAPERIAAE